MNCKSCGCELPEGALVCPECCAFVPRESSNSGDTTQKEQKTVENDFSTSFFSATDDTEDALVDPVAIARAEKIHKNHIRYGITAGIVVVVIAVVAIVYGVCFSGYKLAAYRYIKGMDHSSGSMYVAMVPDKFLDYLNGTYGFTRREVKSTVSDYFVSWNNSYSPGNMSYTITSKTWLDDDEIADIADDIYSDYKIKVDISKAISIDYRIDDSGTIGREHSTFIKIGARWCSVEAMETIDWVCSYSGYGAW